MNLKETWFIQKMEENFLKDQLSTERFEMCPKNRTREKKKGIIQEGALVNLKTKNLLKYKNSIKDPEDKG